MTRQADTESLVRYLVTSLVDEPDSVQINTRASDVATTYEVTVAPDDVGKVIGRQGRIIKAIRTLVRAAASVNGDQVDVDILG
ncbi:MAG: KH domain-containing protein [Coriobacteriia bacterium]|nr:KH domain-containing protein [Coriobacteriia bacterium]